MITKAEIQSIDFASNTCTVRIPLFEHAGLDESVVLTATVINPPGVYNGYVAGDIVMVGFERNTYTMPIVLGKLYLGYNKENEHGGGAVSCTDLNITNSLTIPANTKINYTEDELDAKYSTSTISSITDIVNAIQSLQRANPTQIALQARSSTCCGPTANIYGYTAQGYSSIPEYDHDTGLISSYTICYGGSPELDGEKIKKYMEYMTGIYALPPNIGVVTKYESSLLFKDDLTVWYPVCDGNKLKLLGAQIEPFKYRVLKIIEEAGSSGELHDLPVNLTTPFIGAKSTNTSKSEQPVEFDGLKIEINNLMPGEEE